MLWQLQLYINIGNMTLQHREHSRILFCNLYSNRIFQPIKRWTTCLHTLSYPIEHTWQWVKRGMFMFNGTKKIRKVRKTIHHEPVHEWYRNLILGVAILPGIRRASFLVKIRPLVWDISILHGHSWWIVIFFYELTAYLTWAKVEERMFSYIYWVKQRKQPIWYARNIPEACSTMRAFGVLSNAFSLNASARQSACKRSRLSR